MTSSRQHQPHDVSSTLKAQDSLLLSWYEVKGHDLDCVSSSTQVDKGAVVSHFAQQLLGIHTPAANSSQW